MKRVLFLGLATVYSMITCEQNEYYSYPLPEIDNYKPVINDSYMKEQILKEVGFSELLKITSNFNALLVYKKNHP